MSFVFKISVLGFDRVSPIFLKISVLGFDRVSPIILKISVLALIKLSSTYEEFNHSIFITCFWLLDVHITN